MQRKVVLDQLALLDAELDGIDDVIIRMDAKIPEEINNAIDGVKAAYDARIAAEVAEVMGTKWE